ncbi:MULTISPECIES: ParA family protein [unclassified Acinetobacter]|uniref:ParA family protein n=1 Tax=unclassified Acinetobacter TaxID=196816 RepID=UPI0015D3B9E8|nr:MULTISPECIES: ParA family protein [unclassified Acinetobacter]UUS62532.1 ParA family protein [Acinetobacter sp. YH16056_T]
MDLQALKKNTVALTVANQKGGVGKTVLASNIAVFAENNYQVVVVDLDPQMNASKVFERRGYKTYLTFDLFQNEIDFSTIELNDSNAIFKASPDLLNLNDLDLDLFAKNIQNLKEYNDNLFIVFDTPPVAGALQIISLICGDFLISPIEMKEFSIDGVSQIINTFQNVKQHHNPGLQFLGMVASRVKRGSPLQLEILNSLKENYGNMLFKTEIFERQVIDEAVTSGKAVWELSKSKENGKLMKELLEEVFQQIESMQ